MMLKRRVRSLAVTSSAIASVIALTVLGAAGASASVTAAASPGHAAVTTVAAGAHAVTAPAGAAMPAASGVEYRNYNTNIVGQTMCLGISGNKINADAVLWPCTRSQQQWYIGSSNNAGFFQIAWTAANGTKQCLGVAGGSTEENAHVVGWDCEGTSHQDQYWDIISSSCEGWYVIVNYKTVTEDVTKVIGVAANSTKSGAPIVIYDNQHKCNNQAWITAAPGT
jgi:Ricin-type beta-trefoil lectin domain-like